MQRQASDACRGIAEIPRLIASGSLPPLTSYESPPIEPPPRAALFAPLPNGLGTPQVEHLTSYLHRLARLHQLRLSHLTRELVRPVVWSVRGDHGRGRFAAAFRRRSVPFGSLFGGGPEALLWVWALELLTGRTDLRYLTLVSYGERASMWLRPARAWCAACYHDLRQLGRDGYDQLRWACASVVRCDIHDGPLWLAARTAARASPGRRSKASTGTSNIAGAAGAGWAAEPVPPLRLRFLLARAMPRPRVRRPNGRRFWTMSWPARIGCGLVRRTTRRRPASSPSSRTSTLPATSTDTCSRRFGGAGRSSAPACGTRSGRPRA